MHYGNNENLKIKLTDVIYVPQLHGHLISVNKLTSKGFELHFKDNECLITRYEETIVRASEQFGLL